MSFGLTALWEGESIRRMPLEDLRQHHRELLAQLRYVDHWHRLVSARLDLAVAAVTGVDEPFAFAETDPMIPPAALRTLLGIACDDDRLGETSLLSRLREAQTDLEAYAAVLRESAESAAMNLAARALGTAEETGQESATA